MKKSIVLSIIIVFAFSWYFSLQGKKPENTIPIGSPLIIYSTQSGKCKVTGEDGVSVMPCEVRLKSGG